VTQTGDHEVEADPGKVVEMRPYLKNKIQTKGLGGVTSVVEFLPSMLETWGSIYSSGKKERERDAFMHFSYTLYHVDTELNKY
jgi:hypothetical protein